MAGPLGATQWMYDVAGFYPTVLEDSLKFNDDESQYLSWTPASTGNLQTWTWSAWVKRGTLGVAQIMFGTQADGSNIGHISFQADDTIKVNNKASDTTGDEAKTVMVFRDASAWYHIVIAFDGAQSTQADRTTFYVNGVEQSRTTVSSKSAGNGYINTAVQHTVGTRGQLLGAYFDGYLSDVHFIDGQALDASSFGEFKDSIWIPARYSGSYGTNGFHLPFKNDDTVEGFNAVTYRGNGGTQSVSGLGLAADLVWIKERSSTSGHVLTDTARGANKHLVSSSNGAETTISNGLTSFDADGFSVGSNGAYNQSGETYVAWAWDAGTGSAASNTNGTIISSVKVNTDYGFSITTYTGNGTNGATVGLGLDTPDLILFKSRNGTNKGWPVFVNAISTDGRKLRFDSTNALDSGTSEWPTVANTATTFRLGSSTFVNENGKNFVAYAWKSVAGYSSIGTYSGTGSSGNSVTTGFRPAFLLYKRTDAGGNDWVIMDTTRSPSNPVEKRLFPNLSDAESASAGGGIDVTDTGFVINNTYANANASGGTYIYMAFADTREAAFWKDVSGQGNHWTPNNLDYRDSLIDSPANNFAVMNPLTGEGTAQEGNLKVAANDNRGFYSSFAMESGKWYWEAVMVSGQPLIGVIATELHVPNSVPNSSGQHTIFYYLDGRVFQNGALLSTEASFAAGDIIGVTYDANTYEIKLYKNNSFQRTITANNQYTYAPACTAGSVSAFWTFNFGQDSTFAGATTAGGNQDGNGIGDFKYPVPSGFLALASSNLPTPTIIDGSEYFNTVLYTGDGTSSNSITGVGFQPDFVWIKPRNLADHHRLSDSVRGVNKSLRSNLTNAEDVGANAYLGSFDSDGFTLDNSDNGWNGSSYNYASWNWKAGGAAVSNTAGSITSQVSANVDAGFSIVSYTGNTTTNTNFTIGHGLGKTPDLVIIKNRDWAAGVKAWQVWASPLGNNSLGLDATNSQSSGDFTYSWNQQPDSTTFTVRADTSVSTTNRYRTNGRTDDYIAYCFANTDGYLKAGSYTGNGSTDGTFVYTGFRPAWVMVKRSSGGGAWGMSDTSRSPDNVVQEGFEANTSLAEFNSSNYYHDILSNGFKLRTSDNAINGSGSTYIYLAFAENPFKYSNAR